MKPAVSFFRNIWNVFRSFSFIIIIQEVLTLYTPTQLFKNTDLCNHPTMTETQRTNIIIIILVVAPFAPRLVLDAAARSRQDPRGSPREQHPPPTPPLPSLDLPRAKGEIKTNGPLISGSCPSQLSCRRKEPSLSNQSFLLATCCFADPDHNNKTSRNNYLFLLMWVLKLPHLFHYAPHPHAPSHTPPLHHPAPPAFCIFYSQGNKVTPASP